MKQKSTLKKAFSSKKKHSQSQSSFVLKSKKSHQNPKPLPSSQNNPDKKLIYHPKNSHKNPSHKYTLKSLTTTSSLHGRSSEDYHQPFKISLKQNLSHNLSLASEDNISYRQYCSIGNKWIPLLTSTQRNKIILPLTQPVKIPQIPSIQKYDHVIPTPNPQTIQQTLQKLNLQLTQTNFSPTISQQMKKHYSSILINIIKKLNQQNKTNPQQHHNQLHNQFNQSFLLHNIFNTNQFTIVNRNVTQVIINKGQDTIMKTSPPHNIQYQNVTNLIKMRQLQQLSLIPPQLLPSTPQQPTLPKQLSPISTTLLSIQQTLQIFFQTITQNNLISQIVSNLKIAWGCPWKQKLTRLTNKKSLSSNIVVIPEYVFSISGTHMGNQSNMYQYIHDKCLFDCINNQLVKLKPFYQSNGETFPWNFRLSSPLTFYDIQQSTLFYVFQQIKIKIIQYCNFLCGILLDIDPPSPQYLILEQRRNQRQDIMIKKYTFTSQEKCLEENQLENQATLALILISDLIFECIIQEIGTFSNL